MIKKHLQYMLFGFLGLLFCVSPAYSYHSGYTNERDFIIPPSSPGSSSYTGSSPTCYCMVFRPGYAEIVECDCTFTYKIIGLKTPVEDSNNNGGHNHNFDTHPIIEPPDGALLTYGSGADEDPTRLGVKGHTLYNPLGVLHPLPEVAGSIEREIIVTSPPGWACGGGCWTGDSWRYLDSINVEIEGIDPNPLSNTGDYHVVSRRDTNRHPEGTYGKPDTINKLKDIAREYFKKTDGRKLSINDISLPKGGLFDYKNNWAAPHQTHRTGTDVDINRTDGGEVYTNCWADYELKRAVEKASNGKNHPRLKCEDAVLMGGLIIWEDVYKHIDFD